MTWFASTSGVVRQRSRGHEKVAGMQRARRLSILAAGLLVTGLVAGCRTEPRVAVYLDTGNISESTVDAIVTDTTAKAKAINEKADEVAAEIARGSAAGVDPSKLPAAPARANVPPRNTIVGVLAAQKICANYWAKLHATDNSVPATPPHKYSEADIASNKLIPLGELARTWAALGDCVDAVGDKVGAGTTPTEADYRDVFERAVKAGLALPNQYDTVKPQLAQLTQINHYVAQRDVLMAQAKADHVKTNPRYQPLEFTLMTISTNTNRTFEAVVLPIGATDSSVPVTEL
jgi:hypothetical protein